ncbi:MAG: PqqD family protein [Candidatus Latescibacterota bacterium]
MGAKQISREAMLSSKPIRNVLVHWERDKNGEVLITFSGAKGRTINLLARIFHVPKERKISLDEIGSAVWEMCDGKCTVERMIRNLSETHQLNRREAEVALTTYLKQLGKKRLIGFAVSRTRKA